MKAHLGEFVYATAGRENGKCFIVVSCEDNYVYLCDGRARKVSKPKKKKEKHVRFTSHFDDFIVNKLSNVGKITNKEVRYSISNYLGELIDDTLCKNSITEK